MAVETLTLLAIANAVVDFDDDGNYCCEINDCQREFKSRRNLVDHCRGHHNERRPHPCKFPGCGKSFLRPAHLLIHNRIHTGEKPFVCDFKGCGKRWNQKSALKQHMRSHTGEKPFVCTVKGCFKSFSTSSSCKRHITTHESSRNRASSFVQQPDWMSGMSEGSCPTSPLSGSSDEDRSPLSGSSDEERLDSPIYKCATVEYSIGETKMAVNFILN